MSFQKTTLRQGQLIQPFGPGAIHVSSNGNSLITAGLDYWFHAAYCDEGNICQSDFEIEERRLKKILQVDAFYSPPDYRKKSKWGGGTTNINITIPVFRFPATHRCKRCSKLISINSDSGEFVKCARCDRYSAVPVPLIAICDAGHAQEFPWYEWVHGSTGSNCTRDNLYLLEKGMTGLGGMVVECRDCNRSRPLSKVTSATDREHTHLSDNLNVNGPPYVCNGSKPWLDIEISEGGCGRPLRASLRSAGNLYFPVIKSALHLPSPKYAKSLQKLFLDPHFTSNLDLLNGIELNDCAERLRKIYPELREVDDLEITLSLKEYYDDCSSSSPNSADPVSQDIELVVREEEYKTFLSSWDTEELKLKNKDISEYDEIISDYFDAVTLLEKIRETRVLSGFTRVYPEHGQTVAELQDLLWGELPKEGKRWLPAQIIYGEGIFLALNKQRLLEWESRKEVIERATLLSNNYIRAQAERGFNVSAISPRFILLHTLAHILINQLTYEAGYSSASLRERLYVSSELDMQGLAIYTAAGDADGTLGGLVKLGNPKFLGGILKNALNKAMWCSADPVCMEVGSKVGQGPDNCNLASCHSCGLLPETACEHFNRFLDRGLLIGSEAEPGIGYFNLEGYS
ncbi:conserved hypothetical protein [Teredinibacter turnerae T7901]|uniref:MrfA-like Zn-binding domain-containing protein n=1 Tax=Teredinibacter turnerae (strain ATCC 39867 / T7901) TaxID=377629 RepID=C5BUI5_TERTT|nr:DUF1998 domain-containing protein [Teredinibacter turnerae]ACR10658.1 conserved hypothetical protein [Teredinibacter turnerae T7901]